MPFLGLKDESIISENTHWNINKIGGKPDWMTDGCQLPHCPYCGCSTILVVQLYCPLGDSIYHRTLYIFTCVKRSCWSQQQSWKVLRCQIPDEVCHKTKVTKPPDRTDQMFATVDDWGDDDGDDWGNDDDVDDGNKKEDILDDSYSEHLKDEELQTGSCIKGVDVSMDNENKGHQILSIVDPNETEFTIETSEENELEIDNFKTMNIHDVDEETDMTDPLHNNLVETEDVGMISKENLENMAFLLDGERTKGIISQSASNVDVQNSATCDSKDTGNGEYSDGGDVNCTLTSFYLNVVDETDTAGSEESSHVKKLFQEYQSREKTDITCLHQSDARGGVNTGEKYEKSEIHHGDRTFHRFMKRVSLCPEQCVRYDWAGTPLYIAAPTTEEVSIATKQRCKHCGQPNVYELQLMPALVNCLLHPDISGSATEFGTVIVYTCKASCWTREDKIKTEFAMCQPDPDSHLFRK